MEEIRKKYICKNQIKKGRSGTRKIIEAIKNGYSIALMIDQRVSEGISAKLFNRNCLTTTIPAQLVKKYNCDVIPVYVERKNNVYFNMYFYKPLKFNNDQSILDKVAKEGLGLTVFVSELEDACQSGIPEKIEKEAARMQWVSDNGLGGFEALVEVALQDFERLGVFSFHLFRSNIFNRNINETWPYTRCLVKEISKNPLLEPHRKENTSCTFKIGSKRSQTVNFTSAHRFWNGEYVRSGGYKREISFWIKNQYYQSEMKIEKNIKKEITFYFNNGGNFFIDVAEDLINKKNDIIYLESLRYLSKQNKDLHGFVSSEISKLIKNN